MRLLTPALTILVLLACSEGEPRGLLDDGFEADLDQAVACTDATFHTWKADGTIALTVAAPDFVERSTLVDDTHYEEVLQISVDDVDVRADVGLDVHANFCTDAFVDNQIDSTYTAYAGTVELVIDWPIDGSDPIGAAVLTDVELEDIWGNTVYIDELVIAELPILRAWGG